VSGTELGARERSVRGFGALWWCKNEFCASFSCVGDPAYLG
jgi:hypothetical protein